MIPGPDAATANYCQSPAFPNMKLIFKLKL